MNFPAEIIVVLLFVPVVLQIILPLAVLAAWPVVMLLKNARSLEPQESFTAIPVGGRREAVATGGS